MKAPRSAVLHVKQNRRCRKASRTATDGKPPILAAGSMCTCISIRGFSGHRAPLRRSIFRLEVLMAGKRSSAARALRKESCGCRISTRQSVLCCRHSDCRHRSAPTNSLSTISFRGTAPSRGSRSVSTSCFATASNSNRERCRHPPSISAGGGPQARVRGRRYRPAQPGAGRRDTTSEGREETGRQTGELVERGTEPESSASPGRIDDMRQEGPCRACALVGLRVAPRRGLESPGPGYSATRRALGGR